MLLHSGVGLPRSLTHRRGQVVENGLVGVGGVVVVLVLVPARAARAHVPAVEPNRKGG